MKILKNIVVVLEHVAFRS